MLACKYSKTWDCVSLYPQPLTCCLVNRKESTGIKGMRDQESPQVYRTSMVPSTQPASSASMSAVVIPDILLLTLGSYPPHSQICLSHPSLLLSLSQLLPLHSGPPSHNNILETLVTSLNVSSISLPCLPQARHCLWRSNRCPRYHRAQRLGYILLAAHSRFQFTIPSPWKKQNSLPFELHTS